MEPLYIRTKDACKLLCISPSKIYKLTMRNAIPFYKVGGTILFKREELIRFVESGLINENRDDIDGFDLLSPFQEAA
jgi:excisionase family DNA binding protein